MAESSSKSEDLSGSDWHTVPKRNSRPQLVEKEFYDKSNAVRVFLDLETTKLDSRCDSGDLFYNMKVALMQSEKSGGRILFPSKVTTYAIETKHIDRIILALSYMQGDFKTYETRALKCAGCKETKQEWVKKPVKKPELLELEMLLDISNHARSLQNMHVSKRNIMIISNDPFFVELGEDIEKRSRGNFRVFTIVPQGLIRIPMKVPLRRLR